jgi:S-adenosylmethionine-diacylglycerol 3-amino-3-carboxypropyl transferase
MKKRAQDQVELNTLIFTVNWEDPESDRKALEIRSGDTLMTITSGACNTLTFLLDDPAVIHTVDINPCQSHLMELKIAAMTRLDHGSFVRFLGLTPGDGRLEAYGRIRPLLSPKAATFWDGQGKVLEEGVLLKGRYDSFVRLVGRFFHLVHGRERIGQLLDARDKDEQAAIYTRFWDGPRTRFVFHLFYNKHVLARMGLKTDYFRFDDGSNSFSGSFLKKFRRVLHNMPVRGNYFLSVYLNGTYRSAEEVPEYLKEENFEVIRSRLDRIRIHTDDAQTWLSTMPDGTFDKLALSNICELMSPADTRRMWEQTLRAAKPGARVCFRNLILPRDVPEDLRPSVVKDEELSRRIFESDRSFVYSKVAAYRVSK